MRKTIIGWAVFIVVCLIVGSQFTTPEDAVLGAFFGGGLVKGIELWGKP